MFAEDEEITELLLNRKVFEKIYPETISQFSMKRVTFTLTVQFILGIIDHENLSKKLSAFYRHEINRVFNEFLQRKYPSLEYFLAGLGSFGSEEMTFNSDIDLIFVVNDLKAIPNAEKVFQDLLSQIRKTLSPIEIDCRLRPEGKSSILVWDIKNYEFYIQKRLRVWELQAFTKISLICGSANLFNTFLELLKTRLKTEKSRTIANEIKEMRKKLYPANLGSKMSMLNLKKSPGGLVDSEFVIQYLALLSINNFSKIAGKGVKIIANLSVNEIDSSDSETLLKNYSFLKRLDFLNQVVFNATTSILPSDKKKISMLSKQMGFDDPEIFRVSLNEVMKSNKILFQKYLAAN